MGSNRHPDQGSNVLLDWFTVSYRSIVLSIVFLVGAAGAAGLYYFFRSASSETPEGSALQELTRAERYYREAESSGEQETFATVLARAGNLLDSARRSYRDRDYGNARSLSIQSQSFSRRVLEVGDGESAFTAKIYRFEGDVKLKRVRQFVWENISGNVALRVGDQIKTASNGSAQIVYFDGTITTIKPGSLLEIRELFEDPSTKVRKVREKLNFGGVHSTTQGGNARGSFHEVSTDTSVARTGDKAQLSVEFDQQAGRTRMAVESGEAEVSAGGRTVRLSNLEQVEVGSDEKLSTRAPILPAPGLVEPIDQRVFVFTEGEPAATTLRWSPVSGAAAYRLQISQQPLFGFLLLDKLDVGSTSVVLPDLAAGSYYWRVSARDARGNEGVFSEVRKFRVGSGRDRGPEDKVPPPLQITEFVPSGALVIIKGKTEPSAAVAVDGQPVDVEDDGTFTAVLRLKREGLNTLEILAQDVAGNETRLRKTVYAESF